MVARLPNLLRKAVSTPNVVGAVVQPQEVTAIGEAQVFAGTEKKKQAAIVQKEATILGDRVDTFEKNKAETELHKASSEVAAEIEEIEDHKTWEKEFSRRMQQRSGKISQGISSGDMRSSFSNTSQRLITQGTARTRALARSREHSVKRAEILNILDENSKMLVGKSNDEQKAIFDSTHELIDTAVAKYGLSPETAWKMKQKFVNDYAISQASAREPWKIVQEMSEDRKVVNGKVVRWKRYPVRRVVNGKVIYSDTPTGTWLDFLDNNQKEELFRKAYAASSGDRVTGYSQEGSDILMKKNLTKKQALAVASTKRFYTEMGVEPHEIPSVRKALEARIENLYATRSTELGQEAAKNILKMTDKSGQSLTRTAALAAALKLPVVQQPAALGRLKIFYDDLDATEIKSRTDQIIKGIKSGDIADIKAAKEAVGPMRDDLEASVKKNIDQYYKETDLVKARKMKEQFEASLKKAEAGNLTDADLVGMSQSDRNYLKALQEKAELTKLSPDYNRLGDHGATWSKWVDATSTMDGRQKVAEMSHVELAKAYRLKPTKEEWQTIEKEWREIRVGFSKETKGPSGMTQTQRVTAAAVNSGIDKRKEYKKFIAFQHEYDLRVRESKATSWSDKQAILDGMVLEKFVTDMAEFGWLSGGDTTQNLYDMSPKDKIRMAKDLKIPSKDHEAFSDHLIVIVRGLWRKGKAVTRDNIYKVWQTRKPRTSAPPAGPPPSPSLATKPLSTAAPDTRHSIYATNPDTLEIYDDMGP